MRNALKTRTESVRAGKHAGKARAALSLGPLEGHVGYFVRRLQVQVFKTFIKTLRPMQIRPAQFSVLVLIECNPGRSQAMLGTALGIERARVARLLHDLERRGWVERRVATGDGRANALHLTGAGEKAMIRIKELAEAHERAMTALLGRKRRSILIEQLREFG